MHTDHHLADNLIARLFSYSPREGRTPLEDYSTECLAWSLRNSEQFRAAFLKLVGVTTIQDAWSVDTQVSFTQAEDEDRDEEGEEAVRNRFDLVLEGKDCVVVIESKVHGKPASAQLTRYWSAMGSRWPNSRQRVLVSLSKRRVDLSGTDAQQITWTDIHRQLGITQSDQHEAEPASFILKSFSEFILEHGMIDKPLIIGNQDFTTYLKVVELWEKLRALVSQVASRTVGAKKKPQFDPLLPGEKHFLVGLYPNESSRGQLEHLWFGFVINSYDEAVPVNIYAEIDFSVSLAKSVQVEKQLANGFTPKRIEDLKGKARFEFGRDLKDGESSLDIEEWFVDRIKRLMELKLR